MKMQRAVLIVIIALTAMSGYAAAQERTRLVESVDVVGNRRLRDVEILRHIKTRPNQRYDEKQTQDDLQTLHKLGAFDKDTTRFFIEEAAKGGVNVIFEVRELPIITDVRFEGLKSISDRQVIESLRRKRIAVMKGDVYNPIEVRNAREFIRYILATHGLPNATVQISTSDVDATSTGITFVIDEQP